MNLLLSVVTWLIFILAPLTSFAQIDLQKGLIACYEFNGNANDGTGHGNDGSPNGPPLTADRNGNLNAAYQFSYGQYISLPSAQFINDSFSYVAWARPSTNPGSDDSENVLSIGSGFNGLAPYLHQTINLSNNYTVPSATGWGCGGWNVGNPETISAQQGALSPPNEWIHVVGTRDKNFIKLYVNGVLVTSNPSFGLTPNYAYETPVARIGGRSNGSQFFDGAIDDVAIFDRALTGDEVLEIFTHGLPCQPLPVAKDVFGCGPTKFNLTASGGDSYSWYSADGTLLFHGNPYPTDVLTTNVTYYVTAFFGAQETPKVKVTAYVNPLPTISCLFPANVPDNFPANYEVSTSSSDFSLQWQFGDGTVVNTNTNSIDHTYYQVGIFQDTVTITDAHGCKAYCAAEVMAGIQFLAPPNIVACSGTSVELEATIFNSTVKSVKWYDDRGTLIHVGNPYTTPILTQPASYFVSVVTGNGTELARQKVDVEINIPPVITCTFPTLLNLGSSGPFNASVTNGTPPYSYSWQIGDSAAPPFSTTTPSLSTQISSAGTVHVSVVVTDANGCSDKCTSDVEIIFAPFVPNIITVNGDGDNEILTLFNKVPEGYDIYTEAYPFQMTVYDRWGLQVFQTNDVASGWHGECAVDGVYYWHIIGGRVDMKGWVDVRK